jgi:nucleoid DNA-binding protein
MQWERHTDIRASKAYKIISIILTTIKDALKRGEDVWIPGFGIFRIRVKKATRSNCAYFPGGKYRTRKPIQEVRDIPPKTYVWFEPSKVLLRHINTPQESHEG